MTPGPINSDAPRKTPYTVLPPALVGGPSTPYVCQALGVTSWHVLRHLGQYRRREQSSRTASTDDISISADRRHGPDQRNAGSAHQYDGQDASHLPPGPYQLTTSTYPYDSYAASPVHRFYQMWQQLDCDAAASEKTKWLGLPRPIYIPGSKSTVGAGSNGAAPPSRFNDTSPAKARRRWASTTCSKATRPISNSSPTPIR